MAAQQQPGPGRKLVNTKSGLKMVAEHHEKQSPFLLKEPIWVPDNQCQQCMECKNKFIMMRRRHHCRRCGLLLCGSCCDIKLPLPRMCFVDPVRHCAKCAAITRKENEFFDRHLKVLINGAVFNISQGQTSTDLEMQCLCKFSTDNRFLLFEGQTVIEPMELACLEGIHIQTGGTDTSGNLLASGMSLRYKDSCEELQNVKLSMTDDGDRKPATIWIAAMQRAVKLLYEGRGIAASPTTSMMLQS